MKKYAPFIVFVFIAIFLLISNAFPSLYGDEYDSLFDAHHLTGNIHAIGYFSQLDLWNSISNSDWFLRTLSVLWFGVGLYWLNNWLKEEQVFNQTRTFIVWLALCNPFLWLYGLQIRFYAMFFASSILFILCFRAWGKSPSPRNIVSLSLSSVLLLTSHLFGVLVLVTAFFHHIWTRFSSKRWILGIFLISSFAMILLPPVRSAAILVVYRMSNPYAAIPEEITTRGISMGMFAKIPLTFYFFTLGERVYPLWWWICIPAMLVIGMALLLGIWKLRELGFIGSLLFFMLCNIPFMYLILDPLAPPGLQGAAPRYLIFVLPYFLILLAHGAQIWKPLQPALILVSIAGLYYLAFPTWSYGAEFVNWKKMLAQSVTPAEKTCVITDGRANAQVDRYIPNGAVVAHQGKLSDCAGFERVVLVSNDYRLLMVRYFDEMSIELSREYNLTSNITNFPAQVTVYERRPQKNFSPPPARLDLPEQELHFPIISPQLAEPIQGFVRMDSKTPSFTMSMPENKGGGWIATNYRPIYLLPEGSPVFKVVLTSAGNINNEIILSDGAQTAAWDGTCIACVQLYQWTKLLHLVGSTTYPGAYREYQASIWGYKLPESIYDSVSISFLLPDGVGYFYGIFPENAKK